MARLKRFRVETDRQIARALLKPGTESRKQLQARANLAGIHYRKLGERIIAQKGYNSPTSPFEGKDHLSVLDKRAHKSRIEGGELIIEVNAPAAGFVEEGNTGQEGEVMKIRVKSSAVKKKRGKRGGVKLTIGGNTQIKQQNGKFYLFTRRVRPAKGYRLLEKAVRSAFR